MMETKDWASLAVSGLALLASVVAFLYAHNERRWRLGASNVDRLLVLFNELAPFMNPRIPDQALADLWSPVSTARLQELKEESERCGDRRLRRALNRWHEELCLVRGHDQPQLTTTGVDAPSPSANQTEALERARATSRKIKLRINKVARHAGPR